MAGRNCKANIATNHRQHSYTHLWTTLGHFKDNPMGINWVGIVFGLGVVISFGYWTTDFLVVQRVLSANNLRAAKMAPVIGAAFKMAVPLHRHPARPHLPWPAADGIPVSPGRRQM